MVAREVAQRVETIKAVLNKQDPDDAEVRQALAALVELLGELVQNTLMIAMR